MARKTRLIALGALTLSLAVAGFVGSAYYAARQVRPFYKQALELHPEVLERGSRELESRATALYSDARQQGTWRALFTADQINGWLATQLAQSQDDALPANFHDPRIAITKDALTLGFRTNSGGIDTVITVDASVFLTENGTVAIRLMSVRAGALPLPIMRLADEIATTCQKLELPVRWTQQSGEPVALVELHGDDDSGDPHLHIDAISLGDSELYVSGHTELRSSPQQTANTTSDNNPQSESEFTLDDYEVNLSPSNKGGGLKVARRTTITDDAPNVETEPEMQEAID